MSEEHRRLRHVFLAPWDQELALETAGHSLEEVEGWLYFWVNQAGFKGLSRSWPPMPLTDRGHVNF